MKILVADDDPISRRLLQASLVTSGYDPALAADGEEALALLRCDGGPRLAVLDWMMPRLDGLQVCQAIRRRESDAYVYIILLTANGKKEEIVQGLEAGADDYLTKPFDLEELKARIRAGRRILDLQDQLVSARDSLRVQATHDPLTGVFNRGAILDLLENEMARTRRTGVPPALLMADLDHFKKINDTYGHPAGDMVLCEASRRMGQNVRAYDAVGRYGGGEFLIVAPGCRQEDAIRMADRMREAICGRPFEITHGLVAMTVSVGVATGAAKMSAEGLLNAADEALYDAKHSGRNVVSVKESP